MSFTPLGNTTMPSKGMVVNIMDAQTVDETKSTVICPSPGIRNHKFSIRVSANVTGAIQLETAPSPDYTGVWSPLGGGPIDLSTIGAAGVLEEMFSNLVITAARARISTVVAGGNVSVDYQGS